jgi:hypothetical protein
MPGTEDRPTHEASVRCLLVLSDMPVSEQSVLGAVLGVQISVGHQMRLRDPLVVLNVATLNVCMLGWVPASQARSGRRVRLRHDDHLASRNNVKRTLLFAVEREEAAGPENLRGKRAGVSSIRTRIPSRRIADSSLAHSDEQERPLASSSTISIAATWTMQWSSSRSSRHCARRAADRARSTQRPGDGVGQGLLH